MIKNLALLLLAGLMIVAAWWLRPDRNLVAPGLSSSLHQSASGSLGKYKFTSPDGTKQFNSEVCTWLTKHGFVVETNAMFADIAGGKEWNEPGSLYCRRYDPTNRIFAFVPDFHDPKHNLQIIGFQSAFRGDGHEVQKRAAEFDLARIEFSKRFPSTWEYKPHKRVS